MSKTRSKSTKQNHRPRLIQPIHWGKNYPGKNSNGWSFILRPGAFFWTAGKLYVGYAWLSSLHHKEDPLWDPEPVELGTIIETFAGFYQLTEIFSEGPPYRRKYAKLQFAYMYKPEDYCGAVHGKVKQGQIPIHETYVLAPDTHLECQWLSQHLLHKEWRNGKNLVRKIQRKSSLQAMREVEKEIRVSMEQSCSSIEDREYMIKKFAV